jgi:hypothetical protein
MTENKPIPKPKKEGQSKTKKNQTDKIKWSIFTEAETRIACNKASDKAGLKLNEWIDQVLREKAQEVLTYKPQPPARMEDVVTDLFVQLRNDLKAQQDDVKAEQGKRIEALEEALKNRPNSVWEWLGVKNKK